MLRSKTFVAVASPREEVLRRELRIRTILNAGKAAGEKPASSDLAACPVLDIADTEITQDVR